MEYALYYAAASAVGAGMGAAIPSVVKKMEKDKCLKYGKPFMQDGISGKSRVFLIVLAAAFAVLSVCFVPLGQVPFYIGFCVIVIVGTLIDNRIRIIPNELVLLLLTLGLAYRLMIVGFTGVLRSLLASLITAGVFLLAAGATYFLKKNIGVGAGDLKLAVTLSFVVGTSGIYLFLFGMAAAMLLYCLSGFLFRKLTIVSTFPMCGQIMAGFVFALFVPYVAPQLSRYFTIPL